MAGNGPSRLIIGCGYLGLRVARRWLAQGDAVAALTRSAERAAAFRERGIRPVVGDILSPDRLRDLPPATTVLYAVGYDRTTEASKRTVYVDGLRNVLLSLPKSVERFVYVSSTSVYGQSNGVWVDETSACEPRTDGGQICLDAERLLQSALADRLPVQV
ncbi:MAG: NAD-dependent epimerase/dehydratase family protein, partial [Planctomycetaceae bacterium]